MVGITQEKQLIISFIQRSCFLKKLTNPKKAEKFNFLFKPFLANVPISYYLKTLEKQMVSVFLSCYKWKHWPEMD